MCIRDRVTAVTRHDILNADYYLEVFRLISLNSGLGCVRGRVVPPSDFRIIVVRVIIHASIPPRSPCRNHQMSIVSLNIRSAIYLGAIKTCIHCALEKKHALITYTSIV